MENKRLKGKKKNKQSRLSWEKFRKRWLEYEEGALKPEEYEKALKEYCEKNNL